VGAAMGIYGDEKYGKAYGVGGRNKREEKI
jgi:hypothetical protein